MEKTEFKIGDEFCLGLVKLRVEESDKKVHRCLQCFLGGLTSDCRAFRTLVGECSGPKREDGKDVFFVKVEE